MGSIDINFATICSIAEDNSNYEYYGFRLDNYKYDVGDTAENSHALYQDPDYDEYGELYYSYISEGRFAGYYDGGELNGTSCLAVDPYDADSVESVLNMLYGYPGNYFTFIAGNYAETGNDPGEIVIEDAKVLYVEKV